MPIFSPKKSLAGRAPETRALSAGRLPRRVFPGRQPPVHRWRVVLLRTLAVCVLVGVLGGVALVAWVSQDLPDPNKLNTRVIPESTKIYARDGTTLLYDIHGNQRRTLVGLSDISASVKQATISIEDKDFYKHGAISLRGTLRAIVVDLISGSKAQGGSTLTQQLVKNSILTNDKSYIRKLKEIILSYQIEQHFSKDQILKLYFNEIPYGSSAYGVEAAAETYFNIHAKDLDLPESALLAAMVQAPTYYSPSGLHQKELLDRQHLVLDEMVKNGYITQAQANDARAVDVLKKISPSRDPITAPHFVFTVRDQLAQKYGDAVVETGGLRIVTTLDQKLQKIAEDEVTAGAAKFTKYNASNAALVAIDPHTGQVLAMVGSVNFFDTEHDGNFNVATAVRNPGSSFKPIVYLTAFTRGYSPDTLLFDLKTNFGPDGSGKDFSPNNYDGKEHGPVTMRQAMAGSLNIPAVKTLYLAGINNVLDMADRFGYTTIDRSRVGLALAIGGGGVTLTQHLGAFATLANDGVRNPVSMILRVEDKNGKVLEQYKQDSTRVVPADNVHQVESIMTDNNARAFVFGSRSPLILPDRPVAAKTGTTNDFRDGWTLGFTPSLAAGVWVGNNNNSAMRAGTDGVVVAAPIWHNFMVRALQGTRVEQFPKPPTNTSSKPILLGQLPADVPIAVDSVTGKQIPDSCLAQWPAQFVSHVTIKAVHDTLFYLNKDDPNGPAPTDPAADPMYVRWEAPVQVWAKKNGDVAQSPGYESCSLRVGGTTSSLNISLTSPLPASTITATSLPVAVSVNDTSLVTSVQYAIDGAVLATATSSPYSATLDLSAIGNGFHALVATATDSLGATASAQTQINLLVGGSAVPTVYFLSPAAHETISASAFPQTVRVAAVDPDGVANVTLSLKQADGTVMVLDSQDNPANQTVSLSWSTTAPGSYQLLATMKSKKGRVTQSDLLPITVAP